MHDYNFQIQGLNFFYHEFLTKIYLREFLKLYKLFFSCHVKLRLKLRLRMNFKNRTSFHGATTFDAHTIVTPFLFVQVVINMCSLAGADPGNYKWGSKFFLFLIFSFFRVKVERYVVKILQTP